MKKSEKIIRITFDKSIFRWDKEDEVAVKIREIESEGWRFKEAKPATLCENLVHCGGALNLIFEKKDNKISSRDG
jgi:hypothetical protein